jgi:hypothetical protein
MLSILCSRTKTGRKGKATLDHLLEAATRQDLLDTS